MDTLSYFILIAFVHLLVISQKGNCNCGLTVVGESPRSKRSCCFGKISCFTCSSRNGSNIDCEDPFHPRPSSYVERCKAPKRGHKGDVFPAHYCIKLTGTSSSTSEKLVVRRCVVQNMENQCGQFKLENDTLHGCILTCDLDGCNNSPPSVKTFQFLILPEIFSTVLMAFLAFFVAS